MGYTGWRYSTERESDKCWRDVSPHVEMSISTHCSPNSFTIFSIKHSPVIKPLVSSYFFLGLSKQRLRSFYIDCISYFNMHFSGTLLSALLLASSALAAPASNSRLARRLARRASRLSPGTTFKSKDSSNSKTKFSTSANTSSDVQYSENWSGVAITSPPSGQTFNAVSGKITVPTPSIPSGVDATDGEYSASAWVGIDGNTYSTAILQTGIDFTVSTSGAVSYDAWYEWYPDYAYDFDLTISAGDVSHPISLRNGQKADKKNR